MRAATSGTVIPMKRLAVALFAWCVLATAVSADDSPLPRPAALKPAVDFWTRVYTEVDTDAGLIHDRDNLAVVYEVIRLDPEGSRRSRVRAVRASKKHYKQILLRLSEGRRDDLDAQERRVLSLWPDDVSNSRLRRAAYNIRFQLGQADKFRAGLVRSGAWEPHIRRTLVKMGLPEELAALPHVESSFNPDAWSRVGAAGIWQFTRATGRRYMRVDHVVDERMDPFASSVAAARLLQHNYSITDDWALAITAYNHGLAGIRRAARRVGSDDIADIVERYDGRNWGFASRNFYAAFLAAVDVDFHSEKYFGDVQRHEPLRTETVELPFYAPADALARAFDVRPHRLRELNRALRRPIWDGIKRVPRGYELRIPARSAPGSPSAKELLARVGREHRYYAQIPDQYHRVRRGESLSLIASRYQVSVRELKALNNLRNANLIRAGQRLRLPVPEADRSLARHEVYQVRRGDTLSGIAARAGLRTSKLAALNGLDDANSIRPGQELRLAESAPPADPETGEIRVAAAASGAGGAAGVPPAAEPEAESDDARAATDTVPTSETTETKATETEVTATEVADADAADADTPSATAAAAARADSLLARLEALGTPPVADRTDAAADAEAEDTANGDEAVTADDSVSTAAVAEGSPSLAADPSDYAVAGDQTIEIQAAETLGHYAEWLDLRASRLRRVNGMRYGTPLVIGHRLKLDFSRVEPETFEQRRLAYHEQLQARFFEQFRITGTETVLVRKNDSLWTLSRRSDNVPVWLLRQYNPDLDFDALHPGNPVNMPVLERQPSAGEAGGDAVEVAEHRDED